MKGEVICAAQVSAGHTSRVIEVYIWQAYDGCQDNSAVLESVTDLEVWVIELPSQSPEEGGLAAARGPSSRQMRLGGMMPLILSRIVYLRRCARSSFVQIRMSCSQSTYRSLMGFISKA